MKAVGVRDLKDNPSRALRAAREQPVLVTNRDEPEALLISVRDLGPDAADVRLALARVLYEDGALSLGRAARLAAVPTEAFIEYLGNRGISIFRQTPVEFEADLEIVRAWLGRDSSSTARG
jgi:prevent-host-death family protein